MNSHPAAGIFPLMSASEFQQLCDSIRQNGQREPIKRLSDGEEGKATARAAKKVGVSEPYVREAAKLAKEDPAAGEAMASGEKSLQDVKRAKTDKRRAAKRKADAERIEAVDDLSEIAGNAQFSTIVIDPPWHYEDEGDSNPYGRGLPTYQTMTIDET